VAPASSSHCCTCTCCCCGMHFCRHHGRSVPGTRKSNDVIVFPASHLQANRPILHLSAPALHLLLTCRTSKRKLSYTWSATLTGHKRLFAVNLAPTRSKSCKLAVSNRAKSWLCSRRHKMHRNVSATTYLFQVCSAGWQRFRAGAAGCQDIWNSCRRETLAQTCCLCICSLMFH
jgi:hypothetical protein